MEELKNTILSAQNYDTTAMARLIDKFEPLLGKYIRIMKYDEDFKSDIILAFIELIHKIDMSAFIKDVNDYVLIKYISTSVYHSYISLSKIKNKTDKERSYSVTFEDNTQGTLITYDTPVNDVILHEFLHDKLTDNEYMCIEYIVLQEYTSVEIASYLGITRQAVNQCKRRAIDKLKNCML